jgi:hypothetical protein
MTRKVPFQIRLIAFQTNEDGTRCVYDIVETSFHHASSFARQFMRNPEISSFIACAPGEWKSGAGREWKREELKQ